MSESSEPTPTRRLTTAEALAEPVVFRDELVAELRLLLGLGKRVSPQQ